MSDFQPLFDTPADSSEFVPLDCAVASEFTPMDFASSAAPGAGFEPTTGLSDGVPASESDDVSEVGESMASVQSEETEASAEATAAEDGEASVDSEQSEIEGAFEPGIDPAIRAIEDAAQKAGYESGMMSGKAEIAERLKEVHDILAQVEGLRAEFFARAVQDVGRTVTRVAEQVIRRELSVSPGDIEGLVRAILTDVQSDDDFVIRVSESDAETLRAAHPALLDLVGRDAGLRIEVDSRLLSGGTVVETSYGKIDASIEQQLEAFAAGVEAWVTTEVEATDD
jgi:flagellar assembly protein FliH